MKVGLVLKDCDLVHHAFGDWPEGNLGAVDSIPLGKDQPSFPINQ